MSNVTIGSGINSFSMAYYESCPKNLRAEAPTVLLIHGMESCKETWAATIASLKSDHCIYAIDLRGHGDSSLGDPSTFSLDRVVQDIHEFVMKKNIKQMVVVGHSMGARVATFYVARHPDNIKALVIEDMEMIPRPKEAVTAVELEHLKSFKQRHASSAEAIKELKSYGFTNEKIESLLQQQKIHAMGGTEEVFIGINPYVTLLAKNEISASEKARSAFKELAQYRFPVHLFTAGSDSSITPEGLTEMSQMHPRLAITPFAQADHRIHKSSPVEYNRKLKEIIATA